MLVPSISSTSTVDEPRHGESPPRSIIIIGSGVFGLTTAYSLSRRPTYENTTITVIDKSPFPAQDGSSIDSSRIIRADYKDELYAQLGAEALDIWRLPPPPLLVNTPAKKSPYAGVGAEGRYSESGLVLVGDGDVEYVTKSYENVKAQVEASSNGSGLSDGRQVEYLSDSEAIKNAMKTGGLSGTQGYYNPFSGWADAEAAMVWVRKQCESEQNIKFITEEVETLWVSTGDGAGKKVEGVVLSNGDMLTADITVLAAGAWSSGLLDLTGRAISTGQVMAYVSVSEEEERELKNIPVTLNLSNGVFYFPPRSGVLKIARHAFGYVNTVDVEGFDGIAAVSISQPVTAINRPGLRIPVADEDLLAKELGTMLPRLKGRTFEKTRLCWYTDTPTGDFLVSYHPNVARLFVATGGSGHAFKFLPVLGEKVADAIEGKLEGGLKEKWRFRDLVTGPVVTLDGSRNGVERTELGGVLRVY
ncbi:hypothetical protein H072_2117 [Dactylellina haptotyla CBS 200.50]|uniref:FAD dependent oxidoreductase domain-containing protein n=1 Tax=Dactylellina haptotyla (strain CBS 200.50) TaxID=1284197 RepID=S8ASD3_DACHA|nr:hypothetical protein H072_2117 [Dactylellina haptotyla CBS 200.50]